MYSIDFLLGEFAFIYDSLYEFNLHKFKSIDFLFCELVFIYEITYTFLNVLYNLIFCEFERSL